MTLLLDRTLQRIFCRTPAFSLGRCSPVDGFQRLFWRKTGKVKEEAAESTAVVDKERALAERQRQLLARGLPKKRPIPGVSHVVVVASGKGGVGKSTTAVNLALSLSQIGKGRLRVGLLDADVFGPSIPTMMNLNDSPEHDEEDFMLPLNNFGLKTMSVGFLVGPDSPVVMRGLMVMQWIDRLLYKVRWGPLDVLVIDTPPGTGDTQLSLSQNVPISGAVIVSTPQDLSLVDAKRGAKMFAKVEIPVLGLVQNMSAFVCPNCNHTSHIFGQDGVKEMARSSELEFLGEIPLHLDIRSCADEGRPIVVSRPDSPQSTAYRLLADKIAQKLEI